MAQRVGGLGTATLRTERRPSEVVQVMAEGMQTRLAVPLDSIAFNPRNPQGRQVRGVTEMVNGVKEHGIIQPVIVAGVEEWLEAHPEDAAAVAGRSWVALDGHRRLAAATLAGRTEVPVVIRSPNIDEALVRLHTSKALKLTAIEEALQYRHLTQVKGMTQVQLAEELGVSQPLIARRLKLLELPDAIQVAIDLGMVEITEALDMMRDHDADLIERVGEEVEASVQRLVLTGEAEQPTGDEKESGKRDRKGIDLAGTVRLADSKRTAERSKEAAQRRAADLEAEYCEDVKSRIESRLSKQIYSDEEVSAAAAARNLIVVPGRSTEPSYYLIEGAADNDPAVVETQARRHATEARERALRLAVVGKLPAPALREALILTTLGGLGLGTHTTTLAHDLALHAELSAKAVGEWTWRKSLEKTPSNQEDRLAWVIALAALETLVRTEGVAWSRTHARYFRLLHDTTGYEPTEWERRRLNAIDLPGEGM